MAALKQKIMDNQDRIGLWKIEEPCAFFEQQLPGIVNNPNWYRKTKGRKLEWLASRYLLTKLLDVKGAYQLYKNHTGKPFFNNSSLNVSFSHSAKYVAAIIGENRVGIDIQRMTPRIKKLSFKFLCETEKEKFTQEKELENLHLIWGAKEALYKVYGTTDLFFKRDIEVQTIDRNENKGKIIALVNRTNKQTTHEIAYEWIEDHLLVHTIN